MKSTVMKSGSPLKTVKMVDGGPKKGGSVNITTVVSTFVISKSSLVTHRGNLYIRFLPKLLGLYQCKVNFF